MKQPLALESKESKIRLDKWLWAARFYKTRSLSAQDIDKGRVMVNGATAKPGRELRLSDRIDLRSGPLIRTVVVRALSGVRGPANAAALLYEETPASVANRLAAAERRHLAPEPAAAMAQGRPSKRDRRELDAWRRPTPPSWDARWSASLEDH